MTHQGYPETSFLVGRDRPGHEIEIFNEANPYSIASILDESIKHKILNVDQTLLGLEEDELREKLKPNPTLNKLRISFWYEYDQCVRRGAKLVSFRVYSGICSREYWLKQALTPARLAWILTPVSSYATSMEEALEFSISQLRKVLMAPLYKPNGYLDTAAANVILNIYKVLDQRVHGAITQKVEMKKLVVSQQMHGKVPSEKSIDEQIVEMENKLIENRKVVEVINAEAKTVGNGEAEN
jgi:hypothetical protein